MTHARVRARLSRYVDGELRGRERARLERHLLACAACRAEARALRRTVALLHELPEPEPPPGWADAALARLRAEPEPARVGVIGRMGERLGAWLGAPGAAPTAAAAAGLALALGLAVLDPGAFVPGGAEGGAPPADAGPEAPVAARSAPGAPEGDAGAGAPAPAASPQRVIAAPASASSGSSRAPEAPAPRAAPGRRAAAGDAEDRPDAPPTRAADPPALRECLRAGPGGEEAEEGSCAPWHAWMARLALVDPSAFVAEMESLPAAERERWLRELSSFAFRSGSAQLLASELRKAPDPRAASLAVHFERAAAGR